MNKPAKEVKEESKKETKQEQIDITKLPTLNVGMVGHIDHGKTTLLSKLTGKWTDTHSEELKRGITIKLGYADIIIKKQGDNYNIKQGTPERYVTFVDAPGHEMLMATMLSGAAIMDAAILVIAANEGIKPQTKEHLVALQAKNIKNIIIAQNKIDLLTREQAIANHKVIKEFVKGTIAENSPIIPISSQQEINIDKLLEALCQIKIPERELGGAPVFLIARSFDINRPGTLVQEIKGGVLGGALKRGTLKVGDIIEIKPGINTKRENKIIYIPLKTKIVSMHKGNYSIQVAFPGGSLAIETELDPFLTKADSLSGCVASLEGKLPDPVEKIKMKFSLFKEVLGMQEKKQVENLKPIENLLLSINTTITVGNIIKMKGNEAELSLKIPIVPFQGDNVGIARNIQGHWRLIGFGEII
jgi:translation initiation factor 2 subunit 3